MKIKLATALVTGLFLSGCASSNPYLLSDKNLVTSSIEVVDNRDAKDIKGGLPLFGNPTYSVPDNRFSPSLIEMFKSELARSSISGEKLIIDSFSVDNYFGQTYRRGQAANGVIVLGNSDDKDAIFVDLSGSLDGKPFNSRVMRAYSATPPMTYMGMHYDLPESRAATKQAVLAAIKDAIGSLK